MLQGFVSLKLYLPYINEYNLNLSHCHLFKTWDAFDLRVNFELVKLQKVDVYGTLSKEQSSKQLILALFHN